MNDLEIKKYLNDIKRNIHASKKDKDSFLLSISNAIMDLMESNDSISIKEIESQIGTADELIDNFNNLNKEYSLKRIKRIKITIFCAVGATTILLLVSIFLVVFLEKIGFFFVK